VTRFFGYDTGAILWQIRGRRLTASNVRQSPAFNKVVLPVEDNPSWNRRDFLAGLASSGIAVDAVLRSVLAGDSEEPRRPLTHVLVNEDHFRRRYPKDVESLLSSAQAFAEQFGGQVIDVSADVSPAAIKRRFLRVASIPQRLLIFGEEAGIRRFKVRIPRLELETDYFYGDLDGDGLAEVAVSRALGSPKAMLRQLGHSAAVTAPHALLFSDNPRQQLEMNRFAGVLSSMGCGLEVRDWGDPAMLVKADVIVLAGHGDPNGWYGGVNWTICTVPTVPELPRHPVVFAGACSTATPGAPILRRFLEKGCRSYIGANSPAYGFTSAWLANELNMHLVDSMVSHPDWTVAELIGEARRRFVKNNNMAATLLRLEKGESPRASVENVSTSLQWQVFGDITATFPRSKPQTPYKRHPLVNGSSTLEPGQTIVVPFEIGPDDGVPTLYFRADWDKKDVSPSLQLDILQNKTLVHQLNWRRQREFWAYSDTRLGGYWDQDRYHAFALVPLFHRPGANEAIVRLTHSPKPIQIQMGSAVQVWPKRQPRRLPPPQVSRHKRGINLLWLCRNEDLDPMRKTLVATERLQFDRHENFGDMLAPYEFPNDADHLFDLSRYDVIFIDDIANGYRSFPRGMGAKVRDFVRNGGGLIMAGSYESYSGQQAYDGTHGGYQHTPIAEVLPVVLQDKDDCVKKKVKIGGIDAKHAIAAGLDWSSIPPITGYNKVTAKPEARVLARLEGDDPFLVVGRFDKGRVVAVTARSARDWSEEFKKWVYYPRFWGNVIRWASNTPAEEA
jgi:uncharacterized membrane protein